MLINQRDIEYLVSVKKNRSISRAARECCVTQPALSNQIKRIEERLGVVIFDRRKTSIELTNSGARILQSAEALLSNMQEMSDVVRAFRDPLSLPLRIGIFPTLAPYAVPLLCESLHRTCDGAEIFFSEAYSDDLLDQLIARDIDLAMLALPIERDAVETVSLFDEDFVLAMPKGHKLAGRSVVDEADLPYSEIILLDRGHCLRDHALSLCENGNVGADIPSSLKATSMETICQYVVHGFGCTLLPALAVAELARRPLDLSFAKIASERFKRRIGFAYRANCPRKGLMPPIVEAVMDTFPTDIVTLVAD